MHENCIFCAIISRKLDGYIVYEDEKAVAILDKFPVSPGHTLVMPRAHYSDYLDAKEDEITYLALITKKLAKRIMQRLGADGVRILTNVGASAGQAIFHLHIHIIPTWGSGYPDVYRDFIPRKEQPKEYYEKLVELLSSDK
ncbi:MAG: HIT family protein [Sulfolobales archaeon]|nr:HIT family protein [Sulfolobales archaeon]MCG2893238.1 HIT family protein [Sulfolobales archaeon]MCG2910261.1 HIT family protein [Sulfolobales archaeon]